MDRTMKIYVFLFILVTTHSICAEDSLLLIKKFIPNNPIILEAGARFGEDTLRMSALWPQGTIYAFEPLPTSAAQLRHNILGSKNINFFELALSDKSGAAQFYVDGPNPGASSLHTPIAYVEEYRQGTITVNCITIAEWAMEQHVDHIDFMWLDMEGHELKLLETMPNYLLDGIKAVYMEVNIVPRWANIPLRDEVITWMQNHGFVPISEERNPIQSNILFVRQSLHE